MKRTILMSTVVALIFLFSSCATFITRKAALDETPSGIRIYPPKIYLMVDTGQNKTTLIYLPDYSRAYDVKPLTILAKQDFKIELEDGQLKTLTSNQDTTAFLTFMKEAASMGAKAMGMPVSKQVINGTFGLKSGIYQLNDEGVFHRIQ